MPAVRSDAVASAIPRMDSAFHFLLLDSARKPLACGRLHFNAPDEAQVRFMAVHEDARGRGYGRSHSRGIGGRDNVTEFYAKHDYAVVGEAETLFGVIRHVRMAKPLS